MHPYLCIYYDRLKAGKTEEIKGSFSAEELDLIDPEIPFTKPVQVDGEGYVVEGDLIFFFSARTEIELPCLICSEPVKYALEVEKVYKTFSIAECKGGVCDLVGPIREELLLALPTFLECSGGKCPSRKELKKFLKAEGEGDLYHPFKDLS